MQKQKVIVESFILLLIFALVGSAPAFLFGREEGVSAVSGYQLVWSDEFNGSTLDTGKWGYQNGTWTGSSVQNCYTSDNVAVTGGSLLITARYEPAYACFSQTRDFTSGFIQTRNIASWTYGYFEARIKMPASANSVWPAFWMSPETAVYGSWPQSGEIDIVEVRGHTPTQVNANAHWGVSSSNKQQRQMSASVASVADWHTYAVEWSEGELKYYLDGVLFHTVNNFTAPNATTHPGPFNIPFYLRLNMAVGGTYLSAPHNDANNNTLQFPAVMEVDYVRVYEKQAVSPAPTPTPAPTTPASPSAAGSPDPASPTADSTTQDSADPTAANQSLDTAAPTGDQQLVTDQSEIADKNTSDSDAGNTIQTDAKSSKSSGIPTPVFFGGIAVGVVTFSVVGIVLLINPKLFLRLLHR